MNTVLAFQSQAQAVSFYDAAVNALTAAKSLEEVKEIADKSVAVKEYARRAKDRSLEIDAAELRIKAERRLGELLKKLPLSKGGRPKNETGNTELPVLETGNSESPVSEASEPLRYPPGWKLKWNDPAPITLDELGIDKRLSQRSQKLAEISERSLESKLKTWREDAERGAGRITASILRKPRNVRQSVTHSELVALQNIWRRASIEDRETFLQWAKEN